MVFDFAALPPEINSARMYAGAGSGPMMAAAAAWNNTAAELSMTATACQSVISELTSGEWLGPSSAAMAGATAPYLEWMHTTAGELEHAAAQAMASAAAYETAFAMTVPPAEITANRVQLAALVATNILGQNTPAIMATEALYAEMWAQDAAAMYGYAGSAASAASLNPLMSPAPTNSPGGLGSQAAAVASAAATDSQTAGLQGLVSNVPNALQSLATPLAAQVADSPLDEFFNNNLVINVPYAILDTVAWQMFAIIPSAVLYGWTLQGGSAGAAAAAGGLGAGLAGSGAAAAAAPAAVAGAAVPAGGLGAAPVLAGMGSASPVGGLSVPAAWSAATPDAGASTLAGSGWTAPPEESMPMTNVAAGMPAVASSGRGGYGFSTPRYGVKPTVMPKPVMV